VYELLNYTPPAADEVASDLLAPFIFIETYPVIIISDDCRVIPLAIFIFSWFSFFSATLIPKENTQ